MRTNAPPRPRRARGVLSRLLATTALITATALTTSGLNVPATAPATALTAAATPEAFDAAAAAQVREDQCRLGYVLRQGGPAMKAVARSGLQGAEAALHQAANTQYWTSTPLSTAYQQDHDAAYAKAGELNSRRSVWESPLSDLHLPTFATEAAFQNAPDPDFFDQSGLGVWIGDRMWIAESSFYGDLTPVAGKESTDRATAIADSLFATAPDPSDPSWNDFTAERDAWKWNLTYMHPLYADDARLFLQYGGFPKQAPEPDSTEFRIDVEALKARFASCASANPVDPHHVLDAEVEAASTEWQVEIAGQAAQRDTILAAEAQSNADLSVAAQAMGEALAQSWLADHLSQWQAYWLKQTPASAGLSYPTDAQFARVKADIVHAQARAAGRLLVASRAALSAKAQADKATTAQTQAYAIADAAGQPRGRGLLAAQQAAQVTKASAAAALAASKATETAANATRASAADSKTLMALADTQAHATKAEFRRAAAEEAAAQAKAAADGAAVQAAKAAENATKAKAAQDKAEAAEATAKTAAADADTKRQTAEAEAAKARSERARADQEHAKAEASEATAEAQRTAASQARSDAQTAAATAASKRADAEDAESRATKARDAARDAAEDLDAALSEAAAADAEAAAAEGTDAAAAARAAADQADAKADTAASAASSADQAASTATTAAKNARSAATRAEGAAARSKAAADAAQADVAVTEAAVKKAHAAAAEAISASGQARANAVQAKAEATKAHDQAVAASQNATAARAEAQAASADAVRTAGFAYSTAQAAQAARDSALQVVKPANDAIELGSPYLDTDSSAGLAVLTGQASLTIAQQQLAVAKAKAAQAAKAADEAAKLAAEADADAKDAAQASAQAAQSAAAAADSQHRAEASAAEAAAAAAAAKKAEARTVDYHEQAKADADAAATAAQMASEDAAAADASATEAERDAGAARAASDAADSEAATARGAAAQADTDATAAEAAASRADQAADDAQQAASQAEEDRATQAQAARIEANSGIDYKITITSYWTEPHGNCVGTGSGPNAGCDITITYHYQGTIEFYLVAPCMETFDTGCVSERISLGEEPYSGENTISQHVNGWEVTENVLKSLFSDFLDCLNGKVSGCLWSASVVIPVDRVLKSSKLLLAMETALRSGVGLVKAADAIKAALAAGDVGGAFASTVIARLGYLTGITATGTREQKLDQLVRAYYLGWDPLKGKYLLDEASTGLLYEQKTGAKLIRYDPQGTVGSSPDWVDAAGRKYDAMGRNLKEKYFPGQWNKTGKSGLRTTIKHHVEKADVTIFDVTNLTDANVQIIKDFLREQGWVDKVVFVKENP